jgi:aminoglycoside 6'-N-acetyltransferase
VILRGARIMLRPAGPQDAARLAEIQAEPEVARWWGAPDVAELERQLTGERADRTFAIELDGAVAGMIQYWEEEDPEARHAGIDLYLTRSAQGRGHGREAVALLARHLHTDRGHHRIVIDPAVDNLPAIRCYTAAGFSPVGRMRRAWRDPAGMWRDVLLMELVFDDQDAMR